jgi:hypothetical protein
VAPVVVPGSFDERAAPVPERISAEEAKRAQPLPSRGGDGRAAERDQDLFDRNRDRQTQETPTLTIWSSSMIRLGGSSNTFYPQRVPLAGAASGGPFTLSTAITFPIVPSAFGESMQFRQTGLAAGSFDPATGQVMLQVPLNAVDADADAAPLPIQLTTGTSVARSESGQVVSLTGRGRGADGSFTLVALQKIPSGYGNGFEEHLVAFEVQGQLNFPTSLSSPPERGR